MKLLESEELGLLKDKDCTRIQNSTPLRMLIASLCSCVIGIILMAATSRYLMLGAFLCFLVCIVITTLLSKKGKISIETSCLIPMLMLCFIYTPLSWFTFEGLLGCTPYLSILFLTMIVLSYYSKVQMFLISAYAAELVGLIIYWLIHSSSGQDSILILNILVAYILTTIIIVSMVEAVKRRYLEINKKIIDMSMRDELTGLLNRRALKNIFFQLDNSFCIKGTDYATIIFDINKFKSINDRYGHNVGDSAIKNVAECIQQCIGEADYACRFGGDEFLVILQDIEKEKVLQISSNIKKALFEIQGYAFAISVSVGCALRSECSTITEMLELADQLMYQEKKSAG